MLSILFMTAIFRNILQIICKIIMSPAHAHAHAHTRCDRFHLNILRGKHTYWRHMYLKFVYTDGVHCFVTISLLKHWRYNSQIGIEYTHTWKNYNFVPVAFYLTNLKIYYKSGWRRWAYYIYDICLSSLLGVFALSHRVYE